MADYPALPLWTDAYIGDTQHLTLEEHGAYLKLLMIAWRSPDCALPDDDKRLATMLGITRKKWTALKPAVATFFSRSDGSWTQKRLTKERRRVEELSAKNRSNAEKRWRSNALKNHNTDAATAYASAIPNSMPNQCTHIQIHTQTQEGAVPKGGEDISTTPRAREEPAANAASGPDGPPPPNDELLEIPVSMRHGDWHEREEAVRLFNEVAQRVGWPRVQRVTQKRTAALRQRLLECGGLGGWQEALAKAEASPLLRGERNGQGHEGWRLDFDFLVRQSAFTKLVEGGYDDAASEAAARRQQAIDDVVRQMSEEEDEVE